MAERKIHTIPVFKDQNISAGTWGTSHPIDLRDISVKGDISVSYTVAACGTNADCGTTTLEILGCAVFDGTYVSPSANGTFGTSGTAGGSGFIAITPPVMPFVRIRGNAGTSNSSKVTAYLHVR
jgi:hypothetical protein